MALGCGASPGTEAHEASVVRHLQAADREQTRAAEHGTRTDPPLPIYCDSKSARERVLDVVRHYQEHAREAERYRELAAKHRVAAAALVEAERAACAGLGSHDRDLSPFFHVEDIASVKLLGDQDRAGRPRSGAGARIVFRKVPGLTADSLRRIVDCHRARAASVGYVMPEMSYCPLALKDVKATVSPAAEGLAVEVTSDDPAVAAEIVRRTRALPVDSKDSAAPGEDDLTPPAGVGPNRAE